MAAIYRDPVTYGRLAGLRGPPGRVGSDLALHRLRHEMEDTMNASIALRRAMPGAVLALLLAAAPAYSSPLAAPGAETAEQVSPLRLEINVPAYCLEAFVEGERVATYPVTIGKRWEPTD